MDCEGKVNPDAPTLSTPPRKREIALGIRLGSPLPSGFHVGSLSSLWGISCGKILQPMWCFDGPSNLSQMRVGGRCGGPVLRLVWDGSGGRDAASNPDG